LLLLGWSRVLARPRARGVPLEGQPNVLVHGWTQVQKDEKPHSADERLAQIPNPKSLELSNRRYPTLSTRPGICCGARLPEAVRLPEYVARKRSRAWY